MDVMKTPVKVVQEKEGWQDWSPLTPLRRNSLFKTSKVLTPINENQSDDRERTKRRSMAVMQKRISSTQSPALPGYTPHIPAGEKEIKEHFDVCLKMFAENKINVKNAWSLKIIDYMCAMVGSCSKKNSLQLGSASLDVSTKVYSIRVDDIHSEGLKLASSMARTTQKERLQDGGDDGSSEEDDAKIKTKKKKKRRFSQNNKHTISKDVNFLVCEIPKVESATFQTRTNSDWSTVDNFFTSKLMNDISGNKFMFLSATKAWESEADEDLSILATKMYPSEKKYPNKIEICREFSKFEVDNWDPDKEEDYNETMDSTIRNNDLIFDDKGIPMAELDGSIHDIFNQPGDHLMDSDEEEISPAQAATRGDVVNIDNLQPIDEESNANDYLYQSNISVNLFSHIWAGPSHWKLKYLQRTKARFSGANAAITEKNGKRKRHVQDHAILEWKLFNDLLIPQDKKISEGFNPYVDPAKLSLPLNYFVKKSQSLLTKPSTLLKCKNNADKQTIDNQNYECSPYNYDNPEDNDYCSQNIVDNDADDDDLPECTQVEMAGCHQNLAGVNLIDKPDMVPETHITFATRAKRMDMKKLKSKIWEIINTDCPETEGVTNFTNVYSKLPGILNVKMKEELSSSLAFIGVLHLANEENLKLIGNGNMSDFTIEKDPGPKQINFFN